MYFRSTTATLLPLPANVHASSLEPAPVSQDDEVVVLNLRPRFHHFSLPGSLFIRDREGRLLDRRSHNVGVRDGDGMGRIDF